MFEITISWYVSGYGIIGIHLCFKIFPSLKSLVISSGILSSYLLEPPVHGPDLLLGELGVPEQLAELHRALALHGHALGDHLLDVEPEVDRRRVRVARHIKAVL